VKKLAEKKTMLTYEGLKRLEDELQELKVVRRKDVAAKIKEARSQGDLSENAEYDAAKEEQAEIEARIGLIEKMLRNAEVIDEDDLDADSISIGSKVTILDLEYNEEVEYLIVGSTEADPIGGRISNESPLGIALLDKRVGDNISVEAPDGIIKYKILAIA
jgi:transcription elongation factor GreA